MLFDTNETKYSKDGIYQMSKLIRRKTKQNICVWCGKRLWWWQRRRCVSPRATAPGDVESSGVWCKTCSDVRRLPKSELGKWIEAAITCAIMCVVLILVVLAIEYFDKLGWI